jgi:hypothetical protein
MWQEVAQSGELRGRIENIQKTSRSVRLRLVLKDGLP